jgi:G3E family GTPase
MNLSGPRFLLTVLGGFLGAGKTTWLRHHLHSGVFRDAIVVVNEAASAAVDHVLLGSANPIHVLAGGCACCEGREELLGLLREISGSTRGVATSEPRRIVLETSGLADPQSILAVIASDQRLSQCLEVTEVVVIVDAVNGAELYEMKRSRVGRSHAPIASLSPRRTQSSLRMSCACSTLCRA